jgi:predicted Zn-ribbon and HTH transcriptional regulator
MKYDELHSVKGIVTDAIKKSRLLKQGLIQGNWPKIVGIDYAKKSYVAMLKNHKLTIHVESSIWLQQFSFIKSEIIEKANEYLEMDYIVDIQFKVARVDLANYFINQDEEEKFEPEKILLENNKLNKIEKISQEIEDDEIRDRIKKLMITSKKREKFLLEEGNSKCIDCGSIFKGHKARCITCENKLRKMKRELIYDLVKTNPYITYEEVRIVLRDLRVEEFDDIKLKIKERYYKEMHDFINKDRIKEYKEHAKIYFSLETGIKDNSEIEFLVNNYLLRIEEI